ncbi:hypothetical protein LguiB_004462 [Lonicera macranthoides]
MLNTCGSYFLGLELICRQNKLCLILEVCLLVAMDVDGENGVKETGVLVLSFVKKF